MIFAPQGNYTPFFKKTHLNLDLLGACRFFQKSGVPSVFLESARVSKKLGRYSLFAKDPFLIFESKGGRSTVRSYDFVEEIKGDPFEILRRVLCLFSYPQGPGWPPFLGGAVGYLGYEAKNLIEPKRFPQGKPGLSLPDVYFLFFDHGVVQDHKKGEAYLFSNRRVGGDFMKTRIAALKKINLLEENLRHLLKGKKISPGGPIPFKPPTKISSSFSRNAFKRAVHNAKEYIRRGDIYQANLSQRLDFPFHASALDVYENLRKINPSSFFGFLDTGDFQILSGSPERLIKLEGGILETRPIAGTRSRGKTPLEDSMLARELVLNEKERAEHIMLVDLERNDMGRVAEYGSVSVDELMVVEDYSHVKHIVSNVRGVLRSGLDGVDVLKSFFPGGTITGAPKIRSMEVIDELEPVGRGPYTGSMGYFSFSGNMDFNIIIRSLIIKNKKAYLNVGAGIVADSNPDQEYDETLYKAEGVLSAVFGEKRVKGFLKQRGVARRLS